MGSLAVRDAVRFENADGSDGKRRTGVIMAIGTAYAMIIYGRGSERPGTCAVVREGSQAAAAMSLYKTTYFYAESLRRVRVELLERCGHSPPTVFLDLKAIFSEGMRHLKTIGG